METLRFSKIGKEDIAFGNSTFEVALSDGRRVELSEVNISAFLGDDGVDTNVMFTDGTGSSATLGQDSNFTFDKSTDQLTLAGSGGLRIGSSGTAAELLHVGANGAVAVKIENTGVGTNDVSLLFAINGSTDWNITLDDSASDNLLISEGASVSSTPHLALHRSSTAVTIGTDTKSANNANGLVIDQGASDDQALSLKSSDVAHGVTDVTETDTFFYIRKHDGATGGSIVAGATEASVGMQLWGISTTEDTTTTSGSLCATVANSFVKSGTTVTSFGSTANIFGMYNNNLAKVIIKGDGDVHNAAGVTAMSTFDDHDDIKLVEAAKTIMSPNFKDTLGDWVDSHVEILKEGGVIHGEEGNWFISHRGLNGLLIDAIRQLGMRIHKLEEDLNV